MPFFLSNFADKLYLKRMAAECSPQLFAKLAIFGFMLMQLNDIRVRRAMFLRKRYARRPKLGKSTLLLRHAIKHLEFRLVMQSKIREYCLIREIPLETHNFKKFSGE